MSRFVGVALALALMFAAPSAAVAKVRIYVDLTNQRMIVVSGGGERYTWPISSARSGFSTPRGTFRPTSLQPMHFSKKYHNSPMPHSIFFTGGYAIHGSYEVGALGRPASHGCIRISPEHAETLYELVQQEGASISIQGAPRRQAAYVRYRSDRDGGWAPPFERRVPLFEDSWQPAPFSDY